MEAAAPVHLRFDAFELDEAEARLLRGGAPVALPPKAFAVLCALARDAGRLVSKDLLLDRAWGHQHVSESVLKTTISQLRAALDDDAKQPRYIETASRRGYRFIGSAAVATKEATKEAAKEAAEAPPSIVGRAAALRRLRSAWQAAQQGRRQVLWVAGEPGVGKTTLLEAFAGGIHDALCAFGQCVEQYGAGEPYLPVLDALGALCRRDPALPALMRQVAPAWLLQLPWLSAEAEREALQRGLAGTGQQRMLRELGELLDRYTAQQPLLLVTEDLHWSDHATVQLLDHVARRRGPARLLWLGSFRPAELIAEAHPLKSLRHELRLHRLAEELALEPFSEREVADYVGRRFPGRPLTEGFARALHARTDGLPLFLANVVDDLAARGLGEATPSSDEQALAELRVPEGLAGMIERQIDRLDPADCALLEAASVCGAEFDAGALAEALQHDPAAVGARCDALLRRRHWLGPPAEATGPGAEPRYAFGHGLYRQVFYERIGSRARAQLHRRVALAMERRRAAGDGVTAAELAMHHERSHETAAALHHYADAAESALRHFAPTEALKLTGHALGLLARLPEGPEADALELELLGPRAVAASQLLGTVAPESTAVFERIEALSTRMPGKTRRALEMELGWVFQRRGDYADAIAHATRKAALAEQRGDRLLLMSACNLMGATLFFQGALAEARRWLERGLALFDQLAGPAGEVSLVMDPGASLHARLARVLAHQGHVAAARGHVAAALARSEAVGQPYGRLYALLQAGIVELRLGNPAQALAHGQALARLVADQAVVEGEAFAAWLQGCALVEMGQAAPGLVSIERGHHELLLPGRLGAGACAVLGHEAAALLALGRADEARECLARAMVLAQELGERAYRPDLLIVMAHCEQAAGDAAAARHALQAALDEACSQEAGWLVLAVRVELAGIGAGDPQGLEQAWRELGAETNTALGARAAQLLGQAGAGPPPDER